MMNDTDINKLLSCLSFRILLSPLSLYSKFTHDRIKEFNKCDLSDASLHLINLSLISPIIIRTMILHCSSTHG